MKKEIIAGLIAIIAILAMVMFVGCWEKEAPTSISSQTIVPVPVSASTPTAKLGEVQGKLVESESQKPLAGAAIILCLVNNEEECTLQVSLIATTKEDGTFKLFGVPLGKYIVLYNTSGEAKEGWREIDQLKINYKLQGRRPCSPTSFITDEFYDTFGGSGKVFMQKGASVTLRDGIIESVEGAITSEKYGLTIEFHDGKPMMLQVESRKTSHIEVIAAGIPTLTPLPTLTPTPSPTPTVTPVPLTPTSMPTSSPTTTATEVPTPEEKMVLGFEIIFTIAGLLAVAYLLRKRG